VAVVAVAAAGAAAVFASSVVFLVQALTWRASPAAVMKASAKRMFEVTNDFISDAPLRCSYPGL
jgi:hypothetical protein